VGFNVASVKELDAWATWLDELGIEHSGIRTGDQPFPFATLVFRDPDNIQLELFTVC
jgi:glyoxylase I family protein